MDIVSAILRTDSSRTSYYNLSSVTDSVSALTTRQFINLRAPNSAGKFGRGTENTSRKRNFKITNGCHGNQEILSRPRYWSNDFESFTIEPPSPDDFACQKLAKSTKRFQTEGPPRNCLEIKTTVRLKWP